MTGGCVESSFIQLSVITQDLLRFSLVYITHRSSSTSKFTLISHNLLFIRTILQSNVWEMKRSVKKSRRMCCGCFTPPPPVHGGETGVMGASNGRAHYLADHLLLGGRTCLSVPDTDTEEARSHGEKVPLLYICCVWTPVNRSRD